MLAVSTSKTVTIFGKKLAQARRRAGLSQEDFARAIGRSVSSVGRLEGMNVVNVFQNLRPSLISALGMTAEQFDRDIVAPYSPSLVEPQNQPDGVDPRPIVLNPIYDIDVSATIWAHVPIAELNTDDPHQRAILEDGRFELRIVGDCMEPAYPSGSIVRCRLIRSADEVVPLNRAYVFCHTDGAATFKVLVRLHGDGDDAEFELASFNQKKYPGSFRVKCNDIGRIARAVGVVHSEPELDFKLRKPK